SAIAGTNGITAGTFSSSQDAGGVYLDYTPNVVPVSQPVITNVTLSGSSVIFSGTNGVGGQEYHVLTSTNVGLARTNWTSEQTNTFETGGIFSVTNPYSAGTPSRFY